MNKHIILLLLFIFILYNFVYSEPPKCITNDNSREGSTWYIYEFSGENGYLSFSDQSIIRSNKPLRTSRDSPLLKTFTQAKINKNFNYVTYNNQPAGPNIYNYKYKNFSPPDGGHTKGFFIWNKEGGIHVMHSIPDFPQYKTKGDGNSNNIGERKIEWYEDDILIFRQGSRKPNTGKIDWTENYPKSQQAQYAYCYSLLKDDIDLFVYRHLVMTNSIIGVVNDIEVRNSLSFFHKTGAPKIFETFERINSRQITDEENAININFYKSEDLTTEKISELIKKDTIEEGNGKFPLNILSKHAYNFIVHSKHQHYSSVSPNPDTFYFYQKDQYYPDKKVANYFINQLDENPNDGTINIWEYASNFKKDDGNSLLGPIYLQTQHYDDIGKGKVPKLNDLIYQVEEVKIEDIPIMTRKTDHTKQAYSVANYNNNNNNDNNNNNNNISWFCVGDLNFMDKQSNKGGSILCFKNKVLSDYFSSKVLSFKYKDKKDKIIIASMFDLVRRYFVKQISSALSDLNVEILSPLDKIFPIGKETELWVTVDNRGKLTKERFSHGHVSMEVNNKVKLGFRNFCLPSFFYRNWNYKTILFQSDKITSAEYLCHTIAVEFTMINPLYTIRENDVLQGKTSPIPSVLKLKKENVELFLLEVQTSFLLDRINELHILPKNKQKLYDYIHVQKMPFFKEQNSKFSTSSHCWNSPVYPKLYGTCIDIYFFCLKETNNNNLDMNLFYNAIGTIVDPSRQFSYPNNYILPKYLEHIQCLHSFNDNLNTNKRKLEPNTSSGPPKKRTRFLLGGGAL